VREPSDKRLAGLHYSGIRGLRIFDLAPGRPIFGFQKKRIAGLQRTRLLKICSASEKPVSAGRFFCRLSEAPAAKGQKSEGGDDDPLQCPLSHFAKQHF
jgi:hypothetical protein